MSAATLPKTTVTAKKLVSHNFVRRRIELTFILGQGAFGTDGELRVTPAAGDASGTRTNANTASLSAGLRVKAHIQVLGNGPGSIAILQVYGLPRSILNQLVSIQQYSVYQRENKVIISAGDDFNGMGVVYEGQISQSWADYTSMPDTILHLSAISGGFYLVKPATPTSYNGSADVSTVIDSIAHQMGYTMENNGVSVQLATPYFPGTAVDQIRAACAAANIDYVIIDEIKTVVIKPRGKPRGGLIPLIAPDTGMIGYPVHSPTGIIVRNVFNRNIRLFGLVKVESDLKPANGEWYVNGITHDLESETPGGQWTTTFEATNPGNPHAQPSIR